MEGSARVCCPELVSRCRVKYLGQRWVAAVTNFQGCVHIHLFPFDIPQYRPYRPACNPEFMPVTAPSAITACPVLIHTEYSHKSTNVEILHVNSSAIVSHLCRFFSGRRQLQTCCLRFINSDLSRLTSRASELFRVRRESGPRGRQHPQGAARRREGERRNAVQLSGHLQNQPGNRNPPACTFSAPLLLLKSCSAGETRAISLALLSGQQNMLLRVISPFFFPPHISSSKACSSRSALGLLERRGTAGMLRTQICS